MTHGPISLTVIGIVFIVSVLRLMYLLSQKEQSFIRAVTSTTNLVDIGAVLVVLGAAALVIVGISRYLMEV